MDGGDTRKPGSDPKILLRLSEQFLRRRHFDDCRKYALQAHQLNPNFPGVSEILAVADVLLAANHQSSTGTIRDWYQVLQINRYSQNPDLIKRKYDQLYGLLNPSSNKFPFANEAFEIARNACYVLSDPLRKAEFDEFLKKLIDEDEELKDESVFWTVCPYCYYLFEFPRVYVEHCLRCPNDKCSKAFTCIEIDRPPVEVLKVGKYVCSGFVMLGFRNGCWNPFAPANKQKAKISEKIVEISDEEEEETGGAEGVKVAVEKAVVKRKKSTAKNTKKVTGVGNRVRKEAITSAEVEEEEDDCEFF